VFSGEETAAVKDGKPLDQLPRGAVRKLEALDMIEYRKVLGRNLNMLMGNCKGRKINGLPPVP